MHSAVIEPNEAADIVVASPAARDITGRIAVDDSTGAIVYPH